jgi:glycosyltransferase involved in cell wall biosynthesis
MELSPEVTVVLPTKDRPVLLRQTLASVSAQEGVAAQVIVVDDGSSVPFADDGTSGLAVRVLRHDRPLGVSAARNHGLAEVTTPWVAFLDDDDLWGPRKLARQLAAVDDTGFDWACSATASFLRDQVLDVTDAPVQDDLSRELLRGNCVPGSASSVLVRTALAREVGGFDESLPSLEDWDFWIRLAQRSRVARVAEVDVAYRVHHRSMSHDLSDQRAALLSIQRKYRQLDPPLLVEPDAYFLQYWARIELRSGARASGLRRLAHLLVRHGHLAVLRTAVGAALPQVAQRHLRARRLAARGTPDWSWLHPYLAT